MKRYQGHLYETHRDWHPVIIRQSADWMDNVIHRPAWLSTHCPNHDYDAWCYPDDELSDPNHRTIYFFRDAETAMMFALRWA